MTPPGVSTVDVSGFLRFGKRRHPLYLGIALLVAIEATVSATLIVSYFYLAFTAPQWPPADTPPPDPLLPTVNVVLLALSALTMWWAGRGIDRGDGRVLTAGVGASTLLATIVLVLRGIQMHGFAFQWDSHAYGSIIWTITGFHFVHVASAIAGTAAVTLLAYRGYFTPRRQLGVVVDTLYWYFVAGIWVPFYLVMYWTPRLG